MERGSQGGGFTGEGADFVETNVTKLILAIRHIQLSYLNFQCTFFSKLLKFKKYIFINYENL